ncbi:XrtA/PEP-CTERM system exopolysaccharide export protein [Pseudomaricurvus sp. HS19]|uniref:XrtA/PEP-CTERM system exopolysaccharide export protein n=1 Tax=Pseudomaricurvus sp. HS19 TaxID=2692626 RepID=UPI00136FE482|nr:sugar ABC transporter substrate-binding protein [Pseudomaricurvus sp. HS19]
MFKGIFAVLSRLCILPVFVVGTFLAGCAGNTTYPEVSQAPDYEYIVGAGDSVEIFVWGNPELSTTVVVRPDGKITTRLVEDIPASGRSSTQLAREIETAYSRYVKSPVVSVIVNRFVGVPTQQVRVVGEALQPLSVPYNKHMSLLDLMIAVGGLSEFAAGNKSVLVRNFNGQQEMYTLRLDDLLKDGDISVNTPMMPGDIVIIPEAWF